MLISPAQLNIAQIKTRSDRKGGWLQMPGFTSMLIRKCILNMGLTRRAAAKVFIYIKRLSTYIIRVITNERILKKKLHLMTHHTISPCFKSLVHHPPRRCDFIFSLELGDRWDFEDKIHSLIFLLRQALYLENCQCGNSMESPILVSNELTGKTTKIFPTYRDYLREMAPKSTFIGKLSISPELDLLLFKFKAYLFITFGCAGSSLLCGILSSYVEWASHCSGFSWTLGFVGFSRCGSWA